MTVRAETGIGLVAEAAAITQGKETGELTPEKWLRWLHAEHSMIRCFLLSVRIESIPYYASTQLRTHHIGVEPFVRSQRPTAGGCGRV